MYFKPIGFEHASGCWNHLELMLVEEFKMQTVKAGGVPDLVVCNCHTNCDKLYSNIRKQYPHSKIVFFTGENQRMNYKNCDLAICFDHNSNSKNLRFPLWNFYTDYGAQLVQKEQKRQTQPFTRADLAKKNLFCGFVHRNSVTRRDNFVKLLSKYKQVSCAGKVLNNCAPIGPTHADKLAFVSKCKFFMAFENAKQTGYSTEKIVHPFMADAIPLYWGDTIIGDDFNKEAFLCRHDFKSDEEFIAKIVELDNDDEQYLKMVNQPIFAPNTDGQRYRSLLKDRIKTLLDSMTPLGLAQYNTNKEQLNLVHVSKEANQFLLRECTNNNVNYFLSDGKSAKLLNQRSKLAPNLKNNIKFSSVHNHLEYSKDMYKKLRNPIIDSSNTITLFGNEFQSVQDELSKRLELRPTKPLLILGNGPSLKTLIDFCNSEGRGGLNWLHKHFDTYGLNASYRYYETENFFPTFFGSFDNKVTPYHSNHILEYMERGNWQTRSFFTIKEFTLPQLIGHPRVDARKCHRAYNPSWYTINTGAACSGHTTAKWALQQGYREVYIIGVDANYKNFVKGSAKSEKGGLVMKETPESNPNYFSADYQQEGDHYNVPGAEGHIRSWCELAMNLDINKQLNALVLNLSSISKLDMFPKVDLTTVLSKLD